MEVVKVTLKLGGAGIQRSVAILAAEKRHTYAHVLTSALQVASLLRSHLHPVLPSSCDTRPANCSQPPTTDGSTVPANDTRQYGTRVGIIAKPCAEFVAGMWGAWLNGAVAVPLALSYPEAELLHVFTDAGVSIVFGTEDDRTILQSVAEKVSAQFFLLPSVSSTEGDNKELDIEQLLSEVCKSSATVSDDKGALIIYTSGTTGKPKGVVHTHAGLRAQVQILSKAWEYNSSDRFLHCLPLHHVHGLINGLLAPLYVGASVDFLPKFSTSGVWKKWRSSYASKGENEVEGTITVFTGVPTVYVRLLQGYDAMDDESQKASAIAASRLRLMMCGSSALPQPVMDKWETITGHRLLERYGMTEFGMALSNPLHGERRRGFVGLPLPGVEIKIAEDETNGSAPGVGELYVKSPSMFKEYWNKAQVTKESFSDDGYFKTGDTVTREDGYIKILGRSSVDIIKVGGYKISALEIEEVLLEHPTIAECAVLGVPDKDYGEILSVVVIPNEKLASEAAAKAEPVITLQQLQKWALEKMAPYKIPQQLLVWESMPRNAMGKVNKKELKTVLTQSSSIH